MEFKYLKCIFSVEISSVNASKPNEFQAAWVLKKVRDNDFKLMNKNDLAFHKAVCRQKTIN